MLPIDIVESLFLVIIQHEECDSTVVSAVMVALQDLGNIGN